MLRPLIKTLIKQAGLISVNKRANKSANKSANSSKTPATDHKKKKKNKDNDGDEKNRKKQGGQKGAKGSTPTQVAQPDHIIYPCDVKFLWQAVDRTSE
ncbi:MAG: hypothetical protein KAH18_08430 [Psychromonas sp.]|nr:hypothetical protein [Psychromonas sp.]